MSSFCSDAYCGYLNFAIRRERIYQGSNPCSIGVIFEILFRVLLQLPHRLAEKLVLVLLQADAVLGLPREIRT